MKYQEIISELKKGIYRPIYLLMGDEAFFINNISDFIIKNAIEEDQKSFNEVVLYGQDVDVNQIVESVKRYPMMSDKQLVVVKEAQNIKKIEGLLAYTSAPLESTIFVLNFNSAKIDKRSKNGKAFIQSFTKNGCLFESKKLYENQIPEWIQKYGKSKQINIDQKSSVLLTEFLGNDLVKITNEINKLSILVGDDKNVSAEIIEKNIGISKDFNNFELQKAVLQRNVKKSFLIANYFKQNPRKHPLLVTVATLYGYFSKLLGIHLLTNKSQDNIIKKLKISPYFYNDYEIGRKNYNVKKVVQILSDLQEYDLKSKGVNNTSTDDGELLRELLCNIFEKEVVIK